ncbi:MAG: gliding motility-associated C-terminal domain-containing protein [Saprospiraceae bacterium]
MRNLLLFILILFAGKASATHNRAGEITYQQIGDLKIRVTVTTYTKASSTAADRDSLLVEWGDGTSQIVQRFNGNGDLLPNDTKVNYYIAEHTYPARTSYTISMTDPNRNGGIINVNPPASENVPFHIQTTFTFLSSQFQGYNNGPILLQPPIDFGCVGQRFEHNPNAKEIDGDSLSYKLIVPLQSVGTNVPNYTYPDQVNPGPLNKISLDAIKGDFVWESPQKAGEYNIAIQIDEYRNGKLINTMIRDMQILILECDNRPPKITTIDEICVIAGQSVSFNVHAEDPDIGLNQKVKLTALGAPLTLDNSPATFQAPTQFVNPPVDGTFTWNTLCEHIAGQYYSVVFKAEDNLLDTNGLSALKTVRIKVVGPAPEEPSTQVISGDIKLLWKSPYTCDNVPNQFFRGFTIWRKNSSNPFQPDTCTPGLLGRGYVKIAGNQKSIEGDNYVFLDTTVERGRTYCYRILAEFAKLSPGGNPFNVVESLASAEVCTQLSKDVPLITNVDVVKTDPAGEIQVRWSKPKYPDLDTIKYPGPYTYKVLRSEGLSGDFVVEIPGAVFTSGTFAGANDTMFLDNTGINTVVSPYSYKIAFYTGSPEILYGISSSASSVFLQIISSDRKNILSWFEAVPWENLSYTVFRFNDISGVFDSIAKVSAPSYIDQPLENLKSYCYKIRASGSYGLPDIPSPLINFSQENCGTPIDTVPPCAPVLAITNPCNSADPTDPQTEFVNKLSWTDPEITCPGVSDVATFNIYYQANPKDSFILVGIVNKGEALMFLHSTPDGIAGCYVVTALDSLGNESLASNKVCVDNCPSYTLPNTFTPNGDGQNDVFKPYPYRFVASVDFKVFNRWGEVVFQTTSRDLNWEGKNNNGKELADGTYHYICRVFEIRQGGVLPNPTALTGYIEIIR